MQIEKRPLHWAAVAGSKVRQPRTYLPSHHKEQNNHCGEFYHVRYLNGRYPCASVHKEKELHIVETICLSKKRKRSNTSLRITAPGWGMSGYPIAMLVPTQILAKAGSIMAFGQRRMISPDLGGAGAVMI